MALTRALDAENSAVISADVRGKCGCCNAVDDTRISQSLRKRSIVKIVWNSELYPLMQEMTN